MLRAPCGHLCVLRLCVLSSFLCALVTCTATVSSQDVPVTRDIELTLSEGTSMAAAASPDRRWIAIDLLGGIWVLPFRGGQAKRITPELLEARQPSWSPDSQSIAFQAYDDGAWHVYVVPRDGGEAKAVTSGEFDDREPAWSHDGSRIAFSSDRYGGIATIWQVALGSGELQRLTTRDGVMPAWAPNDQEITFISRARDRSCPTDIRQIMPCIWAVNSGGRERIVADPSRSPQPIGVPIGAGWSPDGTEVAYSTVGGHLFVGGRQVSAADEDVFPFRPQWLNRTELLYTADGHVKRRSIGGETSTITFSATVTLRRATYQIAHRALEPVDPQPLKGIVNPVISPNGRMIAFTALGDLWVMPLGGTPVQITNDPAVDLDPAWSPDSAFLAFVSDRGGHMDVWVHDLAGNVDTQVTTERVGVSAPAWSPDGSQIAYIAGSGSVRTARVKPGNCPGGGSDAPTRQQLGRPTWAPGCKTVAVGALFPYSDRYREGLNQLLLLSLEPRGWSESVIFPQHNAGNRQDTGPVWSPDGAQMAFVTEGRLVTVPVDERGGATGPIREVANDQPESPSWEGDSRHLVYQTPNGLRRVVTEGGPPDPIALDLMWRPSAPPARVVVHAGHVLDGTSDGLRGETDIVVERGVIRTVQGHSDDLHTGGVVDASDDYVMPGLIEMHAHLDQSYGANFGRAWLAYGITSLRIPAVNPYAGIEQRESFDAGRRLGPRVFLAGDPFDGIRSYYPGGVAITSDAQLDQELDRASTLGIDFFKTYVRLPDAFQKRVVDYAHARGKPVTSHELYPAVGFGIDGIEHLTGTSRRGYTPKQSSTARAYKDVIDLIAKSGVTITPTIVLNGAFRARLVGDRTLLFDRRLGLYPLPVVSMLTDLVATRSDGSLDAALKPYEANLKAIAAAGGKIIAGTDSPINPYGLALHVEIESYVHAGLTPYQALQTATVNAAQALGLGDDLGTIEVGKIADLTFLGGDPLIDIKNTRDVKRVMKGGRVYSVDDLIKR